MAEVDSGTIEQLLQKAAGGDGASWGLLVAQHHERLRRMVAARLDPRLQGRIDPSDVLQDV
jgi:RNA polymerase sigma-70 factor (ECF subfamily)